MLIYEMIYGKNHPYVRFMAKSVLELDEKLSKCDQSTQLDNGELVNGNQQSNELINYNFLSMKRNVSLLAQKLRDLLAN